jgi:hypothetical protein
MKGKLIKVDDKWYVEYTGVSYKGGNPKQLGNYTKKIETKRLELIPNDQGYMNCFLHVGDDTRVDFKQVLLNPMGREVDPNDLSQNHSGCVWYAELTYDEDDVKGEQKQHLIDIMKGDEELGLYNESREIQPEDIFNDEKREGVKRVIHQHKVLKGLSLVSPAHLQMTDNGHGEFPDSYKLTEKGIQYIIEQLNKE